MKFTEQLESELIKVTSESRGHYSINDPEILNGIISKITGEICCSLDIPGVLKSYRMIMSKPDDNECQRIKNIYQEIIDEYGFEKFISPIRAVSGEDWYSPVRPGYSKNTSLQELEYLLVRPGIVCWVSYDNLNVLPEIPLVMYTPENKEIAKEIWIRYSKECLEVVKDHKEELQESYEVTTVIMRDGRYESMITPVFPTVSLTSEDFMNNYNTNFPESKIKNFLQIDKGGIMIFNGQPGCGKSTYLKSLIFRYPNINFVILPQYLLVNQEAFRQFLLGMTCGEKDSIYIVEDCEQLLVQREENSAMFSSIIGDILNYTDGIFGDLTRTKFIFTFNTSLENIDKAILRPGRLYLKYEFTPLIGENLEKMATKLGYTLGEDERKNGMPLSELYYRTKSEDLVVTSRPKRKRIGFGEVCAEDSGFGF